MANCLATDCQAKAIAKGLCGKHYDRKRRTGFYEDRDMASSPYGADPWTRIKFYGWIVEGDNCWIWQGQKSTDGYGAVFARGKKSRVHRLMYEIHKGTIPPGLFVCHSCDTPLCINPDHLWLGTAKQNGEDMSRKGRSIKGRKMPR